MKASDKIDAARVDLLLTELRLSGVKLVWSALAATADKEGWPAARFLAALAEQELADRGRRRFARHLTEARLPPGKALDAFDRSHLGLRISDSESEKPSNVRISFVNILTFNGFPLRLELRDGLPRIGARMLFALAGSSHLEQRRGWRDLRSLSKRPPKAPAGGRSEVLQRRHD